jgi:hypothetical protein
MKNLLFDLPYDVQNKIFSMHLWNTIYANCSSHLSYLIGKMKPRDSYPYRSLQAKRLQRETFVRRETAKLATALWPEGNNYVPIYMIKRLDSASSYYHKDPYAFQKFNLEPGYIDIKKAESNRELEFGESYGEYLRMAVVRFCLTETNRLQDRAGRPLLFSHSGIQVRGVVSLGDPRVNS